MLRPASNDDHRHQIEARASTAPAYGVRLTVRHRPPIRTSDVLAFFVGMCTAVFLILAALVVIKWSGWLN